MSAADWAMGLFAVVVGIGILYFIFTQPVAIPTSTGPPTLTVEGLPTAYVGAAHSIMVRGSGLQGDIRLRVNGETQTLPCPGVECRFVLPFTFMEEGIHVVHAESGYLAVDWAVDVKTKGLICIDGTPEGLCSTPPLRCVGQSLVSDCSICGCNHGFSCHANVCEKDPLSFTLKFGEMPPLYTTVAASVPIIVTNNSSFPVSGLFVGRIAWYDASAHLLGESSQQFAFDDVGMGVSGTYTIEVVFPKNAASVSGQWFPAGGSYDDSTLLADVPFHSISVKEDTTPPLPPTGLDYSVSEGTLTLVWVPSASSDAVEYLVHQQNFAAGGFTTYSTVGIVSESPYSLPLPPDGTAFILTSRDGAGNESDPTSPLVVNAS